MLSAGIQIAIKRFSQMSLSQLRRYQSIIEIQTEMAFEQKKTEGLIRMQGMVKILQITVDLKEFGTSMDMATIVEQSQSLKSEDFEELLV